MLKETCYSDVCFYAEQVAQQALKAFLYAQGERAVTVHALNALVEQCAAYDPDFASLSEPCRIVGRYYIPTRYPDALVFPEVPFEEYTEVEAGEAQELARQIMHLVQQKLGGPS